jgi:hypothetical protein
MLGRSHHWHRDGLAFQIADRADPLGPEKLEAARVNASEYDDWGSAVHVYEDRPGELNTDIRLAAGHGGGVPEVSVFLNVLHIGKSLSAQEIFSDVLRRLTHPTGLDQPDSSRLGRRLGGGRLGWPSEQSAGSSESRRAQKLSSTPMVVVLFPHGPSSF